MVARTAKADRRLGEAGRALAADPDHLAYASLLARYATRRYGLDREEARAAARLGLCMAAAGFEAERGLKFTTLATTWIRRMLMREAARDLRRGFALDLGRRDRYRVVELPPPLPLSEDDPPAAREGALSGRAGPEIDPGRLAEAIDRLPQPWRIVIRDAYGLPRPGRRPAFTPPPGSAAFARIEAEALAMLRAMLQHEGTHDTEGED